MCIKNFSPMFVQMCTFDEKIRLNFKKKAPLIGMLTKKMSNKRSLSLPMQSGNFADHCPLSLQTVKISFSGEYPFTVHTVKQTVLLAVSTHSALPCFGFTFWSLSGHFTSANIKNNKLNDSDACTCGYM